MSVASAAHVLADQLDRKESITSSDISDVERIINRLKWSVPPYTTRLGAISPHGLAKIVRDVEELARVADRMFE